MQTRFLSRIPFPEELALQQAPVRWDLGVGADRIQLRVPLFSFARHRVWEKATQAIKLRVTYGSATTSHPVGDLIERMDSLPAVVEEGLAAFRDQWGVLPVDFADMIAAVSDPVDLDASWRVMEDWAASRILVLARSEGPDAWRAAFSELLQHELPIRDASRLIVDIGRINTELKKNITADHHQVASDPATYRRRKLSQGLRAMSMASHQPRP